MRLTLLSIVFAVAASPASAHFQMLLPEKASVKKGEKIILTYQWGHPFEHQLFDAPRPNALVVIPAGGKPVDLLEKMEEIEIPVGEKKVKGWRVQYTPEERGDYVFVLKAALIFLEEQGIFVEDSVKVVVHVEAQKGWDALTRPNPEFEFHPLTRPYGLQPGLVFQAHLKMPTRANNGARGGPGGGQGGAGGNPMGVVRNLAGGDSVEVEPYHAAAPKTLPPDEQMTRVVKTDPNGVVTTTLPDAGWWGLTATAKQDGGVREHDGKGYPLKVRTTLWVFVDEKPR